MHRGTANLPLHSGHAPRWLFERMVKISAEIASWIVVEHGTADLLRRLSDPVWFQAFGAVMGMDWHSSGVTTTVCGALKQGLQERGRELGLVVAGGKGRTSRQTPGELTAAGAWLGLDPAPYVQASRMAAKVDNNIQLIARPTTRPSRRCKQRSSKRKSASANRSRRSSGSRSGAMPN